MWVPCPASFPLIYSAVGAGVLRFCPTSLDLVTFIWLNISYYIFFFFLLAYIYIYIYIYIYNISNFFSIQNEI